MQTSTTDMFFAVVGQLKKKQNRKPEKKTIQTDNLAHPCPV